MHRALLAFAQTLLIEPRCPICDGPWDSPLPPTAPCTTCLDALALPGQGLKGLLPLPWCALGAYAGQLRQLLLKLRHPRQGNLIGAFQAVPMDKQGAHSSVCLVDDILTTGSTALAARQALEAAGHRVAGLICLGRTPARVRRR